MPGQIKTQQALYALNEAALAIAQDLALDTVLQKIVDASRELVGAQYAALGVPNKDGLLETFVYSGMSVETAESMPHTPRGLGLLGAIIAEKQTIRVPEICHDHRSVGFPEGHPPMSSFLGVPVTAGDKALGNLYLTNKLDGPEFTAEDQHLVEMFAAHAAVAIQNAHLYEQVEQLAVLEERTRIGMDLHDGVIQSIYAVGLTLESARLSLPAGASAETTKLLEIAVEGLNDAIRDIRNFILDLRPRRFQGDLAQGLRQLSREFQANTLVPIELNVPDDLKHLPSRAARTLFLTTQEALANIARHAKASQVWLTVEVDISTVTLTIKDNGRGFDPKDSTRRVGHGLSNMPARAKETSGKFRLTSAPGQGTTIVMSLPLL